MLPPNAASRDEEEPMENYTLVVLRNSSPVTFNYAIYVTPP